MQTYSTTRPYDPFHHATHLGIRVDFSHHLESNGLWIPGENTILLRPNQIRLLERSTLAHELGHAALGHQDDRPKHEMLADRWAARHLIAPLRLARVAAYTQDLGTWCRELEVTPRILEAYLHDFHERFP